MNDKDKREWEYYKNLHSQHSLMFFTAAESFDKAILTLSTASIGFTLAFLKIIEPKVIYKGLLIFSELFFIVAIISILLTFIFLQKYSLHRVRFYSYKILKKKSTLQLKLCIDKWLKRLQYVSATFFVLGIVLFAIFAIYNI